MGRRSVLLKASLEGVPRWKKEVCGGRAYGQRKTHYSPENGMLMGRTRAGAKLPSAVCGMGAIRVGTGLISGQRITPGKPPSARPAADAGGRRSGPEPGIPGGAGLLV